MIELYIFLLAGAAAFAWLTIRRGSLTAGGASAAIGIGAVATLVVGPQWLLPLFLFFLSSTVISRLLPVTNTASDAKDKQARDVVQVLCNGGVYALTALLCFDVAGDWEPLLLVSMAVATADTWASEIGKYFRGPTLDIVRLQRVPPGLSGGVSLAGSLGGAAGAMFLAAAGFLLLPDYDLATFLAVALAGFLGMVLDSILGAIFQARFADSGGTQLSDVRPPGGRLISGFAWMSNDLVNLFSIGGLTLLYWLMD